MATLCEPSKKLVDVVRGRGFLAVDLQLDDCPADHGSHETLHLRSATADEGSAAKLLKGTCAITMPD